MSKKNALLLLFGLFFAVSFASPDETPEQKEVPQAEAVPLFPPGAILAASYRGDEDLVREILTAGTDKDVRDALGATALHAAVYQPNVSVVKLLLDYGFDPNAKAVKNGNTPLHNAVSANNAPAVKLLIEYGASKWTKNLEGFTPLEKARREGKDGLLVFFR